MPRRIASLGIAASLALASAAANAQNNEPGLPNDLALNRLSYYTVDGAPRFEGGCGTMSAGFAPCRPDNQLFVNLVNQLGGALAPGLLAPAGTIGYNHFYFAYEHSISNIASTAPGGDGLNSPWHKGTLGSPEGRVMVGNSSLRERVPNALYVSRFHVRKAFPYGFELGMQTSYLHDSSMVALGLDVRWALFEGFRTGVGYLPDFAVRGAVNTLVGNPQLYLTVVGLDATLSKALTLAGMSTLTPYIGGQALMILGDSTVIDATPGRSGYQECTRRRVEFSPDGRSSSLVCESGTMPPAGATDNDSQNEMVFVQSRILRWRGVGGLRLKFGVLTLTGEFAVDALDPQWLGNQDGIRGEGRPTASGARQDPSFDNFRQWTASFGAGLTF